jgi:hypothetical protein
MKRLVPAAVTLGALVATLLLCEGLLRVVPAGSDAARVPRLSPRPGRPLAARRQARAPAPVRGKPAPVRRPEPRPRRPDRLPRLPVSRAGARADARRAAPELLHRCQEPRRAARAARPVPGRGRTRGGRNRDAVHPHRGGAARRAHPGLLVLGPLASERRRRRNHRRGAGGGPARAGLARPTAGATRLTGDGLRRALRRDRGAAASATPPPAAPPATTPTRRHPRDGPASS